ncbi:hypothetical protein FEM08_02500 [Flavobacterium gilvum]|nr:hypothetical protein FEM08_02500 [Flavobacterium gilvum]
MNYELLVGQLSVSILYSLSSFFYFLKTVLGKNKKILPKEDYI